MDDWLERFWGEANAFQKAPRSIDPTEREYCSVFPDKICWDCINAFRLMVQHSSNAAIIHRANSSLTAISLACGAGDVTLYSEGVRSLIRILRGTPPSIPDSP